MFVERLNSSQLENVDAVFFGGGSFLLGKPTITDEALKVLRSKKIFYLGIGVEAEIHPIHLELMKDARLIATRSPEQVDKLKIFNKNVLAIPDLIYSLQSKVQLTPKSGRSVLMMPNISVVPKRDDPHWKHVAWTYFKSEFSQFMDWLIHQGYQPHLFSMCQGLEVDDNWVSAELVSYMTHRSQHHIISNDNRPSSLEDMTKLVSKHDVLITQRFHGIVLAEMTRTPYVAIHHHDKLKFSSPGDGVFISYYNSSKLSFINAFEKALKMNFANTLPIESSIFEAFSERVTNLI